MAAAFTPSRVLQRLGRALVAPFAVPPADLEDMLSRARTKRHEAMLLLRAAMGSRRSEAAFLLTSLGMREDLIDRTAEAITDPKFSRFGLLHLAALVGDVDYVLSLMILRKLDPNEPIGGLTPLLLAVRDSNNVDCARYLCESGAIVECPCDNGETLLSVAVQSGNLPMVKLLLLYSSGAANCISPLAIAAKEGVADCVTFLLANGEDADYVDEDGKKPIQAAAARGHRDCVILLYPVTHLSYEEAEAVVETLQGLLGDQVEVTIPEETNAYQEQKTKGTASMFFAIMDKVTPTLIAVCGFGLAYLTTDKRHSYMQKPWFQTFCGFCVMSFCTSIILHGWAAFYKELEPTDELGFVACSYFVLATVLFLLFVVSMIFLSFEGAALKVVISTAVVTLLIIIFSWPVLQKESKSVGRCLVEWMKGKWANRNDFLRFGRA